MTQYNSHRKKNKKQTIKKPQKKKQMTDNKIATEKKTNNRQ
jgi:hypothetical protein